MTIYLKNLQLLKKTLFAKLNDDATLLSLLGASDRITHKNPPTEPIYPCLVYYIYNDKDNVYNENISDGDITTTDIRINIFTNNSVSEIADNIESRIKKLLHGQRTLDSNKIICYSCYRDNLSEPIKDPNLQVWVTTVKYKVTWANR